MKNYIFRDLKSKKDKEDLLEFLRHQTNAEFGGYRLFDGTRTHLMHIPEELTDLIVFLKNYENNNKMKFSNFLEIGFNSGKVNTILHKFFNFKNIVALDTFTAEMSSQELLANIVRKNLTLICGRSDRKENLEIIKKFQPYDLIFVDASHEYKDVKKDLDNYSKMLSDKGIIFAHDIQNEDYTGVNKAWKEFKKKNNFLYKEFSCKKYFFSLGVGLAIKN
ncbi:class I SAM-dependent methyltransferase [Candidatus Nitrosopelagicus sp.]|nr:class I SAM-dependent methyltransferase [Candidatus Nitrosopelagicus sp.]MDC0240878.1 class I SAM-dependent methyltransferase [Candidatus Nitrosopelagicus sp.]